MSKTYTIESLTDFAKIPADRWNAFFEEFTQAVSNMRNVITFTKVSMNLTDEQVERAVRFDLFTWVDDGKKNQVVDFKVIGGEND